MRRTAFPPTQKAETKLRYGENLIRASLCIFDQASPAIAGAKKIQGKELSYNNYVDADSAFKIISERNEMMYLLNSKSINVPAVWRRDPL